MLASRRRRATPLLLALALVLLVFAYHRRDSDRIYEQWRSSIESHPVKLAANSTLGFGAVIAVSKDGSDRRHILVQAANVTDFDLSIPPQPVWTDVDVQRFINGQEDARNERGSPLAWLGHHNALRWFLESGRETALILEDDVDWDIRLRSVQIPLAASAIRQLLPPTRSQHPLANFRNSHTQYWGNHDAWDLLYLGHCGDYFNIVNQDGPDPSRESFNLSAMPHITYEDPTLPPRPQLHPFTQKLFRLLDMPEQSRVLHRSKFPLCSFGYAITRSTAMRLLDDLAPPRYQKDGPRAFDVALLHACRIGGHVQPRIPGFLKRIALLLPAHLHKHATPGLRCWTLNSELFHHMPGQSQIDEIGKKPGDKPRLPPIDLAAQEQIKERNETSNIDCGFWNGAFSFEDGNMEQLHHLQESVGRQGKCLKPGRSPANTTITATPID